MEVCSVCFKNVEGYIFVPPADGEKIFNFCLSSLHTAIAESCIKDFSFTRKNKMPFCKRCFDSAVQLSQLSEQILSFQKELSDLTQEFSISVLHRRSQANLSNKYAINNGRQSTQRKQNIEIDVLAFPPQLFSAVTPPFLSTVTPQFLPEDINVVHQSSHCGSQNESLNTVTLENVKLELNEGVNSFVTNNLLLEENLEIENENIFICGLPGEIKESDGPSADFKEDEHEDDPLSLNKVKKAPTIVKKRRKFVQKGNLGAGDTKAGLLNSIQYPRIILEKNENIFICGLPGEIKESDGPSADFKEDEHEDDPLSLNKVKKAPTIVKKRRKFVQKGNLGAGDTKAGLLNSIQYPRIILEKVKPEACVRNIVSSVKEPIPNKWCGNEDGSSPANNSSYSSTYLPIRKKENRSQKIKKIYPSSKSVKLQSCIKQQRRRIKLNTNGNSFGCELCDKIFNQKCHLRDHMRLHTGEKPFQCPFCPKSFAQYGNLYSHKKIHTGEMPFKCFYCEKAFSGRNYRKKHMKSKHSDCLVDKGVVIL